MRRLVLAALVLAVAVLAIGCGGDDGGEAASPEPLDECVEVEAPEPRDPGANEAPTEPLPSGTTYSLVFETSCGSFTVELDPELAPNTSASLAALAGEAYFDDTIFHRVASGFVIQGGDPTQTGSGGPGYSTVDAPPAGAAYPRGTFAMAKTSFEPAGTSGSQFFVVTTESWSLPADYAIVGSVTEGMETVDRIDALGTGDGPPSQPVVVERVTVTES